MRQFDICNENPILWHYLKSSFLFLYSFANIVVINFIFSKLSINSFLEPTKKTSFFPNKLSLLVGYDPILKEKIYIPEQGLYQNILVTGTIGTGKTSSAMYPFTKQLLTYNSQNSDKIGLLILDVKGNYFKQVEKFAYDLSLENDIIEISLTSNIKYNPLHKPYLNPLVLANRLKTILLLFSENNSESFWLDKAEQILSEAIKFCRLYNNNYVTFYELHRLIMEEQYYKSKIEFLKNKFLSSKLSQKQIYDLNTSLNFFEKEFLVLDSRTLSILRSEISRITNIFVSDLSVFKTFCPSKSELNFKGFSDVLSKGKIVVLNMNIAEYRNLSKIIATYLKLDFQSEIMYNLSKNIHHKSAFICDEYSEYASKTDADFFSLSREAKCINILSTQSYTSLKNALKDENSVKVIIQNLINKIWFRTDDLFTIEEAQKQLGKEEKHYMSTTISENARSTNFNYLTNSFLSKDSNITESLNSYIQKDFIYDTNFFTQFLETFSCLSFLSDGYKIQPPTKLKMFPYFKKN